MLEDEETQPNGLFSAILGLLIQDRVFVKCPDCGKHLALLEVYNENCSFCGKIDFNEMIIVKGIGDEGNDEDSNSSNEEENENPTA